MTPVSWPFLLLFIQTRWQDQRVFCACPAALKRNEPVGGLAYKLVEQRMI